MRGRGARQNCSSVSPKSAYAPEIYAASAWFARHVTLFGEPYTLDLDQIRAVIDTHQNTLVTARAGSGKTRVIVAKVAYLVAHGLANLDEIAIFMFNRTAAAEVNSRIAEVKVDGTSLTEVTPVTIASTFHKFALDIVKLTGEHPQLISEATQEKLIISLFTQVLHDLHLKLPPTERQETLGIVKNFITRAGQKFPGPQGLEALEQAVEAYCQQATSTTDSKRKCRFHQISLTVYRRYWQALQPPTMDFNLLLALATDYLCSANCPGAIRNQITPLKYVLIDEYQDFSYLFFALVQAIRQLAPAAKLFAVGDDWQAINRFAGSDVDYFINFAQYFPEDTINIPLATNYRSNRRIVELANHFMLEHYDPQALPAIPKSRQSGKIYHLNPSKLRLDPSDIHEDALGDGRFVLALAEVMSCNPERVPLGAARLLKATWRIFRHFPESEFMLLHRHNFTSYPGVTLEVFGRALQNLLAQEEILSAEEFSQRVRIMTMHKSKGLEAEIVILLELNRELVMGSHPHATIFPLFGDTREAEVADQERLIYVALTRAKQRLFLLSDDSAPLV